MAFRVGDDGALAALALPRSDDGGRVDPPQGPVMRPAVERPLHRRIGRKRLRERPLLSSHFATRFGFAEIYKDEVKVTLWSGPTSAN